MKNAIILTLLSSVVAVGSPRLSGGQQPVAPALSVSVRSAESSYNIKGKIRLEIQIENVGGGSVLVWRHPGWGVGRMNVRVFDSSGKEVFTAFLADETPPPPREDDFIALERGEFFGTHLSEVATHFVNTPGTYDIFVEYTSPLPEEYLRKSIQLPRLPIWSRERGVIVSNRVRIEITK
jgi:hypothetical protein